jgi:SAM-dependent methyltransferase
VFPEAVAIAGDRTVVGAEVSTKRDGRAEKFREPPHAVSLALTRAGSRYGVVSRPQRISLSQQGESALTPRIASYDGTVDLEEYRRASFETWSAMAPGWERWRDRIDQHAAPVREWLIGQLGPRPGDTVVELSAGVGDTGFAAAKLVGDEGRLISSDFSPAMVEVARRRGAERGLVNVDYRVIDAEHIELDDDSVDAVLCRFGYMLMADPAAALSETRRVLRSGGRLALAVWGPPERNPWAAAAALILIEEGHLPLPEPGAPGVFSMGDEDRTRGLLEGAGFTDVRIEEIPVRFTFGDLDEYERFATDTGGPFAMVLRGLDEAQRAVLRSRLEAALSGFVVDARYQLPGVALGAAAS